MDIHLNCVCSVGTDPCKTTIFDAITWAVFSDQSRDDYTNGDLARHSSNRLMEPKKHSTLFSKVPWHERQQTGLFNHVLISQNKTGYC